MNKYVAADEQGHKYKVKTCVQYSKEKQLALVK